MTGKLLAYHLKSPRVPLVARVPQFENHWVSLTGGCLHPCLAVSFVTDQVHLRYEQPPVLSPDSHVTIGMIQQTQGAVSVLWVSTQTSGSQPGCRGTVGCLLQYPGVPQDNTFFNMSLKKYIFKLSSNPEASRWATGCRVLYISL